MSGLQNPHLEAIRCKVLAERRRRGDADYIDEHVKRVAVILVVDEVHDLEALTLQQSLAICAHTGLSLTEYITAMSFISPRHAEQLRREAHVAD